MNKKWRSISLTLALLLAAGCSSGGQDDTQVPGPLPTAAVLAPSAPGAATEQCDSAVIDYSNAADGYVMVKWTGESDAGIVVRVKGPTNPETYTYYLAADGRYDALPLSDGDGSYQILICQNVSGTKYSQLLSASVDVHLSDSFAPFLRPNQYVDFTADSQAVAKAAELAGGAKNTLGLVEAIYDWVVTNLSYDHDKARTVQPGYLPDIDATLRSGTGICFDYASLMSAMLRSQGVPVKLVIGYTSKGEYHAWIDVWSEQSGWIDGAIRFDGSDWKLMDPTFASSGRQSESVMEYIGNTANYKERFVY